MHWCNTLIDPELRGSSRKYDDEEPGPGVSLKSPGSCQLYLLGHGPSQCNWIFPCVARYMQSGYSSNTGHDLLVVWFSMWDGFFSPRVSCNEGGILRQLVRNTSHMENLTKCICSHTLHFKARSSYQIHCTRLKIMKAMWDRFISQLLYTWGKSEVCETPKCSRDWHNSLASHGRQLPGG